MKKAIFTLLATMICFMVYGQAVPGCGTFSSHATITLSGVSNQTISGDSINAAGGQFCIRLTNCTNIHITKCKLINASTSSYSGALDIHGGSNITVDTCYFENDSYGILIQNVTGGFIVNNYNYFKNCEQVGRTSKGGCSIQWNTVSGGGLRANYNKSYHTTNNVNTGDQFSFYKVNGLATDYMQHYYNEVEGGSIESSGLAGTVLGDLGGSYQDGEFNTYVTAGMEGCQVQGGHDIIMSNNRIYSNRLPVSTVGLAFGNYTSPFVASFNITMANNKINFINAAGQTSSIWFDPNTAFQPNGWLTNTPAGKADASILASMLPVPLFGTCSVVVQPPAISYSPTSYSFTTGVVIGSLVPNNTGGAATSWGVSPALPLGLSLNTSTGVISGTPTAVTASNTYIVTATNAGGNSTEPLTIVVAAPVIIKPNISYSPTGFTYQVGVSISNVSPSNTGGVVTGYSISPSLPSGLVFNTGSGVISGTPTVSNGLTSYAITATNTGGSSIANISITVNPAAVALPNINISPISFIFTVNKGIVAIIPTNSGGFATSWSISPSLSAGLAFNTTTGVISGVPTAIKTITTYTVTGSNTSGVSHKNINITVNAATNTQGHWVFWHGKWVYRK